MNKTQNLIFTAGIKAFSQKGFYKTTMDEIADTAGLAKGTLYYHFKSKEEIFKFIIDEGIKRIEGEVADRVVHLQDPVEKLRTVFSVQLELVIRNVDFFRTMLNQMWGDEVRHTQIRQVLARHFKFVESYIREVLESKGVECRNGEFIAYSFFGGMMATVLYHLINEKKDINELTNALMERLMQNLLK